ncbi:MAG: DUF86 domain-containing protein [Candidatus Methylomirabilales bacterium]
MMDARLITRKISLISGDYEELSRLGRMSLDEYLGDPINEVLAERYLERVIGRMIDINYHLITELGHPPPADYHASFLRLVALQILPADLAKRIARSAGLRNRIVHEYDEIDPRRVHEGLQAAMEDLPAYLRAIHDCLERHRPA